MTQDTLQTFKFPWAGDPWIYNGTCLLFRFLKNLVPEEIEERFPDVTWDITEGAINSPSQERFVEFLGALCNQITDKNYMKPRNYDILYDEDSLLKERFKVIPRPAFTLFHQRLIKGLTAKPANGTKNEEAKVPLDTLSDEELQQLNRFIESQQIKPREVKKGGEIVERYIFNTRWKFFIEPLKGFDWNNKKRYARCDFCGNFGFVKSVSGLNHPLMTSTPKYQNFSSNLKTSPKICPYCAVASHFTSAFLPFLLRDDTYFYALPQITGLKEGIEFWDLLTTQTGGEIFNEWCNFESESRRYDSTHHAFLALLTFVEEKFREIRNRAKEDMELRRDFPDLAGMSDEKLWKLTCKSWTTVYGDGLIPKIVSHYHLTPKLYRFIRRLREEEITLKTFVGSFTYKQTGGDYITRFKDELAKRILDFRDVNLTIEAFLNDAASAGKGHSIWGMSKFLKIYNMEVMKMKESEVNKAISIGLRIGEHCKKEEDRDLLYELRSCTNRTQFLEFLDRATFKIPGLRVGKEFILSLKDDNWTEQKSLVGIYAHQAYYSGQNTESQGGREE